MEKYMRPEISQGVTFTYTDDLEQTSKFFREIMELDFVLDQGPCHIFRVSESSYLGVCKLPDRPTEKTAVTITLVSDDVDGWYKFLTSKGINFLKKPSYSPEFNVYSSLFMSPHGYRIEIQNFENSDWCKSPAI